MGNICSSKGSDVCEPAAEFKPLDRSRDLFHAIMVGDIAAVDDCIKDHADLNVQYNYKKRTPLHIASLMNRPRIAAKLISAGANLEAKDTDECTPLCVALHYSPKTVMLLFEAGADLNVLDLSGNTFLHLMVNSPNYHQLVYRIRIQAFLQNKKRYEALNLQGNTPLSLAASAGDFKFTLHLINAGANIWHKNHAGKTPLDLAIEGKHIDIIELFFQKDMTVVDVATLKSILHLALENNYWKLIKRTFDLLLFKQADAKSNEKVDLARWLSQQGSSLIKKTSPRVALSYNYHVGGSMAERFKGRLNSVLVDYRKIVSLEDGVASFYSNEADRIKVLKKAKYMAKLALYDMDGLIIPGNCKNIDPRLYHKRLNDSINRIDLQRAIAELALIYVAMQFGIPILGVCGGNQLLNVYFDGSVKTLLAVDEKAQDKNERIFIYSESELADIICRHRSKNKLIARYFFGAHSQVIDALGGKNRINNKEDYLSVSAYADDESRNVEAIESKFGSPVLGLQFHPESHVESQFGNIEDNKKIFKAISQSMTTKKNKKIVNLHVQMAGSEWLLKNNMFMHVRCDVGQAAAMDLKEHDADLTWERRFNKIPT